MNRTVKLAVTLLALVFVFGFSVFAEGVYYDYFEVSPNQKAGGINSAIKKIDEIGAVGYSSRQYVYDAQNAYNSLSDTEKTYVVNAEKLNESVNTLKSIGDFDLDGARDSKDLTLLRKHILGIGEINAGFDINQDLKCDILDLVALKKLMTGV